MHKRFLTGWMAAGAVILLGMSACGGKAEDKGAEDTTAAEDTMAVEVAVKDTVVVDSASMDSALIVEETVTPVAPEEGKKGDGYTTTKSGLKYKVVKQGTGKSPKATDVVLVNYEGRLLDGTVFDSSYQSGQPISFPLNRVIAGWTEGLQLMKEGATYEFLIPSNLAYGERGAGPIPPNSDLIFLVELIKVQ